MKRRLSAGNQLIRALVSLAFSVLALWVSPAVADHTPRDHITARAWFEDRSGSLTFEEIRKQEFTPYQGVLARGFGTNPIWVRLSIDPKVNLQPGHGITTQRFVLRLRPTYLDTVELFDPGQSVVGGRVTGDRWPARSDEFRSINLNFEISAEPGPREIYLKITTTSTRLLSAQLLEFSDLYHEDSQLIGVYAIAFGISLLFLVWACVAWLLTKDRVVGVFAISQSGGVLLSFFILGFARYLAPDLFSPAWVDTGMSIAVMFIVFFSVLFYVQLWREYQPPAATLWMLKAILFALPVQLLLFAFGYRELALQLNWLMVLYVPIPNLIIAFTAGVWRIPADQRPPLVPRGGVLVYCFTHLGVMVVGALSALGVLGETSLPIYLVLVHTLLSGALAVLLLQYRFKISSEYQDRLRLQLRLSEQQVVQEQQFRRERDSLFSMLAHELKNAMSTITVLLGSKREEDALRKQVRDSLHDMNEVIDKTIEMARFDDAKIQLKPERFDAIDELRALISMNFQDSGVRLEAPDRLMLSSDIEIFRTVLGNILSNAAKYRSEGSVVDIRVVSEAEPPGGVTFEVVNDPGAVGFPEVEHVFSKYYRSPMSKGFTGSGLGLYLVEGLCKILSGSVSYQRLNNRVCFRVWLPN